jgi:hypothetical protein
VKLKKTLKTLSSGEKNPKKPTGLGFFKKTRVFSNPGGYRYLFAILWPTELSSA